MTTEQIVTVGAIKIVMDKTTLIEMIAVVVVSMTHCGRDRDYRRDHDQNQGMRQPWTGRAT